MKYIFITESDRLPIEVSPNDEYKVLSKAEFVNHATTEGFDDDIKFFYHALLLDEMIYNAFVENGIKVVYYVFEDEKELVTLTFQLNDDIIVYQDPNQTEVIEEEPQEEPVIEEEEPETEEEVQPESVPEKTIGGIPIIETLEEQKPKDNLNVLNLTNLLNNDSLDVEQKENNTPAKVILFGSSKGGTGKTFTCLLSVYRYAKTHPTQKIAVADFDITDGQVGATIGKNNPTMSDYYKNYKAGNNTFYTLSNNVVKNDHFTPNVDFYLAAPAIKAVEEISNDTEFWNNIFKLLITNYDVVFFDSGIDYLGKEPISKLYKIADRIIITTNTSINSIQSVIGQLKTISGKRKNKVFTDPKILDRVRLVITRARNGAPQNDLITQNLTKYAPIVAAFGDMEEKIEKSQWFQNWELWDYEDRTNAAVDRITDFDE